MTTIRNELGRALRKFTLEMESLRWSPHTRRAYDHAAKPFCRWLVRETALATMNEITPETIRTYRLYLVRSKIAPSTQTLRLAAVKTFFRLMAKVGVVERDPASAIDLPRKRAMPVRRAVHLRREDVESRYKCLQLICVEGYVFIMRNQQHPHSLFLIVSGVSEVSVTEYAWCSASWVEGCGDLSLLRALRSVKIDRVGGAGGGVGRRRGRRSPDLRIVAADGFGFAFADLHRHFAPLAARLDPLGGIEAEDVLRAQLVLDVGVDPVQVGGRFDLVQIPACLSTKPA